MKTNKSKNFHVLLQTGFVANWQIVGEPFDPIYYIQTDVTYEIQFHLSSQNNVLYKMDIRTTKFFNSKFYRLIIESLYFFLCKMVKIDKNEK